MSAREKPFACFLIKHIQHYDHDKYWRMRNAVIDPQNNTPLLIKYLYLLKIKKMDAYNNASLGTDIGYGSRFASPPSLPHGIRGIFIHNNVVVGKNCTIFQQVTIGARKQAIDPHDEATPIIGDNVLIGAGAKILGGIVIGNGVKIGANCVVTMDVPDNAVVFLPEPTVIIRKEANEH
ncbi:2,3,4,5-tetrahydropyridine-2,6-dicarboxylate N-acetyltransferase [bioreactor metagenome]|uniref:2,3,4,5-tetrahydropyridine-2,6-dicarboxylate N-acetyltransferase n=1 Tax=bioreactor metagenome TaxID=1076179 RepID=A0A645C2Q6_9ZZZZ|nr:serine acetyltransferase [Oscillospiraceae bacterium]